MRLPLAIRYAGLLADTGVRHGLIGPREVPRLWDRHLLNCAVVADGIPHGASVIDVGAGAGLPGIPIAIARPDLRVVLLEPLLRRTRWLDATVHELGLDTVTVRRGRAAEVVGALSADVVTARAVAGLGVLATWCAPLMTRGGCVLALKGAGAAEEVEHTLRSCGLTAVVQTYGVGLVDPPTTVVRLSAGAGGAAASG
ncbi:MAG TPA: 16S rRNA (guanine(527)-N(7))-methyltransferase RsmG [Dermatophilaceae bacterium]|nr:16S rRNA (guanine(527)-N(7))-methyltransferase RsmG [Dermatophilaceae bacterium]